MTSTQLYLTIGVPSFLVLLSLLQNNARMDRIERRIDDVLTSTHKDALEIMRSMTALHKRVAVVEARQG